jgi:hypothetical protein
MIQVLTPRLLLLLLRGSSATDPKHPKILIWPRMTSSSGQRDSRKSLRTANFARSDPHLAKGRVSMKRYSSTSRSSYHPRAR